METLNRVSTNTRIPLSPDVFRKRWYTFEGLHPNTPVTFFTLSPRVLNTDKVLNSGF